MNKRTSKGSGNMNSNIVSAPLYGSAYPTNSIKSALRHYVELDGNGTPARVLCGKVKLEHVMEDTTEYNAHPATCKTCQRKFAKL